MAANGMSLGHVVKVLLPLLAHLGYFRSARGCETIASISATLQIPLKAVRLSRNAQFVCFVGFAWMSLGLLK